MNDPREAMVDQFSSEGWAGLEMPDGAQDERIKRMMEAARLQAEPIATALRSDAGQFLLKWIVLQTLFLPPTDEDQTCQVGDRMIYLKGLRDGNCGVAWALLKALQVANTPPPTQGISHA